jgi:hypothetical protein
LDVHEHDALTKKKSEYSRGKSKTHHRTLTQQQSNTYLLQKLTSIQNQEKMTLYFGALNNSNQNQNALNQKCSNKVTTTK